MGIEIKLFAGYLITSELSMHLRHSNSWKQTVIMPHSEEKDLITVHFQGHDYLGAYLKTNEVKLSELNSFGSYIQQHFRHYCPDFSIENSKLHIFGQVFVA